MILNGMVITNKGLNEYHMFLDMFSEGKHG